MQIVKCPSCGSDMTLRKSKRHKYRNGSATLFYRCSQYPECTDTHAAHPDGSPQGIPVTREIRALRKHVHDLANEIWPWENREERHKFYEWLALNTRAGHIGQMLEWELLDLEVKLKDLIEQQKNVI